MGWSRGGHERPPWEFGTIFVPNSFGLPLAETSALWRRRQAFSTSADASEIGERISYAARSLVMRRKCATRHWILATKT